MIDNGLITTIISTLIIAIGIVTAYFLRDSRRAIPVAVGPSGIGIGISVSSIGSVGLLYSYAQIPMQAVILASVAGGFSAIICMYYFAGRKLVILLLLGLFLVQIVGALYFFQFSLGLMAVYSGSLLAVLQSLRYSRVNLSAYTGKTDRYLGGLLWPYLVIERSIRRVVRSNRLQIALGGGYVAFNLAILIALPFLISKWTSGLSFESLAFAASLLWLASFLVWSRASDRFNDES